MFFSLEKTFIPSYRNDGTNVLDGVFALGSTRSSRYALVNMGYYMRFITTDAAPIDLVKIGEVLQSHDARYALEIQGKDATLHYDNEAYADLEINQPGDGLFEEEIEELLEFLEDAKGQKKKRVQAVLEDAKQILAAQVLFGGRDLEVTLDRIDPIWEHLFGQHRGLLQADGEGYYDTPEHLMLEAD
jgi:hypothetical protein